MKHYLCNPVVGNYRYQFMKEPMSGRTSVNREAADPTVIRFQGRFYLFASMTLSVWVSDDLVSWEEHRLPEELPLYGYAPDARVAGEYVYFTASDDTECAFYRTKDILQGPYEKVPMPFAYTDPNLFVDRDGRMYFYWGCSTEPIKGVELDPETMQPKGEPVELISSDAFHRGYERIGEDNTVFPLTEDELEEAFQGFLRGKGMTAGDLPPGMENVVRGFLHQAPYIEGAWMDRFGDRFYLQYAFAGTQYNIYGDGVFVSDSPLGPFALAENNPYSYNPGGFMPGAGHGSTFSDESGNLWHAATMRISANHNFERRVGIWPAGLDTDGELFCNQRFGDWPIRVPLGKRDPWVKPDLMLLSHNKTVTASSEAEGHPATLACAEDARTFWEAQEYDALPTLTVDLGESMDVSLVQINFMDDHWDIPSHKDAQRYIDPKERHTRWALYGSHDGYEYIVLEDKRKADTDFAHDLVELEEATQFRFLKLEIYEVPFGVPCISGLRVFGKRQGDCPAAPSYMVARTGELDMDVTIRPQEDATGWLILWGSSADKLYHSRIVYNDDKEDNTIRIGALVSGRDYVVRVDSFNESGITEGTTC